MVCARLKSLWTLGGDARIAPAAVRARRDDRAHCKIEANFKMRARAYFLRVTNILAVQQNMLTLRILIARALPLIRIHLDLT
jgi:hypothetical protein